MRLLVSDLYKVAKSRILWLHIGIPIGVVVLFCAYYSYSPWEETDKVILFFQSIARGFPMIAGIVVTMLYTMDQKAGNYQNLLLYAGGRWKVHVANLITLLLFAFGSMMIATIAFKIGFSIIGFSTGTILQMLYLGALCFLYAVSLYLLQYIICYILGSGPSLTIGILGTLFSVLIYPGKEDFLWKITPCMHGVRMIAYKACRILRPELSSNYSNDYKYGDIWIAGTVLVLTVCFLIFASVWQGNGKAVEE